MTAWIAPRTWVALETHTASQLNAHLRDQLLYLKEQMDKAVQQLTTDTTSHANSGAGATDLTTYSLPAGTLDVDLEAVRIHAWGTFAANISPKQVWMVFGATIVAISSSSATFNNMSWELHAVVVRTGAATQEAYGRFLAPDGSAVANNGTRSTPGETLTGAVTIKCLGDGDATNDIVQRGLIVERIPA